MSSHVLWRSQRVWKVLVFTYRLLTHSWTWLLVCKCACLYLTFLSAIGTNKSPSQCGNCRRPKLGMSQPLRLFSWSSSWNLAHKWARGAICIVCRSVWPEYSYMILAFKVCVDLTGWRSLKNWIYRNCYDVLPLRWCLICIHKSHSQKEFIYNFNLIDVCLHECPCQSKAIWQSSGM